MTSIDLTTIARAGPLGVLLLVAAGIGSALQSSVLTVSEALLAWMLIVVCATGYGMAVDSRQQRAADRAQADKQTEKLIVVIDRNTAVLSEVLHRLSTNEELRGITKELTDAVRQLNNRE